MKKLPLISVIAALLLVVGLLFVNTKPPKPTETAERPMAGAKPQSSFAIDSFELAVKKKLAQHALGELQSIEQQLNTSTDSIKTAALYQQYADVWKEHKQLPIAAHYYSLAAKLENSEKKLTFAAQLFLELARNEHSGELQTWEAKNAATCFDQILFINPANDTAKLSLAEVYFATGEAMKGVALVKEITAKDPENSAANMLLGQQGLISGQNEKAKQRFETVLKNNPKDVEAMLGLAEAYKGLGEKEKAIELLENCKKYIDNPAFAKDVDEYIKNFK